MTAYISASYQDCPQLVREFLLYMKTIRGRAPRTVDAYCTDLKLFLRYLKCTRLNLPLENLSETPIDTLSADFICQITLAEVYGFFHFVQEFQNNHAAARARKASAIRSLYKYLATKTQYLQENPVKDLEVPSIKKALPRYLTLEESLKLLEVVEGRFALRDYCMLTLLLNCGMRLSELVGIRLSDIRDQTLRLLGKGNKERIVYLNQACIDSIAAYLLWRKQAGISGSEDALFVSGRGTRLTPRRVEQIVEQHLKQAGLSGRGYSPHKLRHTAATLMYQHGGVDIRVLKEILGHVNLGTTEIYTHISSRQLEQAAQRSPLAQVQRKHTPTSNADEE